MNKKIKNKLSRIRISGENLTGKLTILLPKKDNKKSPLIKAGKK